MREVVAGIRGAPGIALGPAARLEPNPGVGATAARFSSPAEGAQLFREAQTQVAAQLESLGAELRAEGKDAEADIFDAQAMLASDPALAVEVETLLEEDGITLQEATRRATDALAAALSLLEDPYLRERAADVRGVGEQIVAVLSGAATDREPDLPPGAIVIANDLTPAQTAGLRKRAIGGFATARGTDTGHVAILARALGLPAVVGLGDALLQVPDGTPVILAATEGKLIVAPSEEERQRYEALRAVGHEDEARRRSLIGLPATTTDGHRVALWANLGRPEEAQAAVDLGAEGVGLFRTEFLFLDRDRPPDEEEQAAVYAEVLRVMGDRPVVVRTLDIGGDKPIPYLPRLEEANPFLGVRGIRFCMRFPDLLDNQLRALQRAAVEGDLRIMLPMAATAADVAWARGRLSAAAEALRRDGIPHRADVPLGIMIETPAAAVALDLLVAAGSLSFCSFGTNDLAQYALAADRGNQEIAARYRHDDPAVFRLVHGATEAAKSLGLEASVCGELAADPPAGVALVGLGVEKLSVAPSALLSVKEALRAVSLEDARRAARRAC